VTIQPAGADTIEIDGVRFIFLPSDPVTNDCPSGVNDNTILVRMEFDDFSMLFTADAETEEREWLIGHHPALLAATVPKASHHGSPNGADGAFNGETWIRMVNLRDVIISALRGSPHGHPHAEAMDA
jgi:competence protein ComEC